MSPACNRACRRTWAFRLPVLLLASCFQGQTPTPLPHFSNIAPRSDISYITNNDLSTRKYFPQPMCGGVAIFDFDNDGRMDIFFTNGAKLPEMKKTDPSFSHCLLRNKGDGTFEDVTKKSGLLGVGQGQDLGYTLGVAAGDFDNDGHEDLFICAAGRNTLYRNNGDGTFTDVTAQSGIRKPPDTLSVGAAWFDYDNDGLLDLVVANYTIWTPQTDHRCATAGIEYYCDPRLFYKPVPSRLYHNLGNGKFEDVTEKSGFGAAAGKGMGISIADFNDDGFQDVFIANDTEQNFLFINKGDGTFDEQSLPLGVAYDDTAKAVSSMGSDAKDYDNDGRVDIFYNNLRGQIWALFRNQGDAFQYVSPQAKLTQISRPFSGWSAGFVDFDNDGWKDLYSANGDVDNVKPDSRQHDTMFRNLEGKRFADVSSEMGAAFLRAGYQRGAAFGDLNNDGFQDIVVTSLNERPRILINSADNHNHWIVLELTGHQSNRDAIGAKVKLTTGSGRVLYNQVSSSVGIMSSSDKRVHFGLGDESSVETIQIRWPNGATQKIVRPKADQFLRIDEGK
jgi:enediyne biosynthesis protein E4